MVNYLIAHLILSTVALAAQEAKVSPHLNVQLVTATGENISVFPVDPNEQSNELLFTVTVPPELEKHTSWALEINEKTRNLSYKLSLDGTLPKIIRWDGLFSNNQRIIPKEKYFFRIVLESKKKLTASDWGVFSTVTRSAEPTIRSTSIPALIIIPSAGIDTMMVRTGNYNVLLFPNIFGDIRLVMGEIHSFGIKFEATTNALNAKVRETGLFYSDFSLFYRLRMIGSPMRAPQLPYVPPFADSSLVPKIPSEAWGSPFNVEIGARFYNTVLRGYGNYPIDSEVSRYTRGIAATLNLDLAAGPFRIYGGGETGYSTFRGKVFTASVEGMVAYDQMASLSPGLMARLTMNVGEPAGDNFDGTPLTGRTGSIRNTIAMGGLVLFFKL